ncbi:MAG: hypothetical protein Q4E09_05225 [Eubacteriales bacterium]|nr:hypothetical protein [Eubacteriales bacterium]
MAFYGQDAYCIASGPASDGRSVLQPKTDESAARKSALQLASGVRGTKNASAAGFAAR